MNTTNHTSPSGEDAANGAIGEREAWEQLRGLLAVAMCSFATKVGRKDLDAAVSVLDAITEPGSPIAWLRAALTAEKVAAEPIYQTGNENGHVWRDVTPLDYARADSHKRIVFSAPQQPAQSAEQDERAATRKVIEPLKEPVHIDKALLGGRNAHVVLSGGAGPMCAVFLVNIQITGWNSNEEWAKGYATGFNQAAAWMQDAILALAKETNNG
jgi:hypothetical protein